MLNTHPNILDNHNRTLHEIILNGTENHCSTIWTWLSNDCWTNWDESRWYFLLHVDVIWSYCIFSVSESLYQQTEDIGNISVYSFDMVVLFTRTHIDCIFSLMLRNGMFYANHSINSIETYIEHLVWLKYLS